jgi:uncharacterized protein (TIGR00730 family)
MPERIRSVAVFCGSRPGRDPAHATAAAALGRGLAEAGMTLVYGGGGVGLMRVVAEASLAAGGRVRGIIPDFLTRIERPYPALAELEITDSMHERKTRMYELADAFVTLSGGLGTLDETVEVITWRQLGLHDKPILLLDVAGWARPFVTLVEGLIEEGFAPERNRALFEVVPGVEAALARLRSAVPSLGPEAPAERL